MTDRKYFTKADIFFIIVLFVIGITMTVWIYRPQSSAETWLEVRQNEKLLYKFPLNENIEKTISDTHSNTNHFRIQDGIVTMVDANCSDHTCVKTRGISKVSQSIVCLPHRLTLTIATDNSDSDAPDAIVH